MPFPDGVWSAIIKNGEVVAQYLTIDGRTYVIGAINNVFRLSLLEEFRLTLQGSSTLFPSDTDPGWRTGLIKAKEDTARVRQNANTNAAILYQFGKEEVAIRYIPVTLLAPEVTHTDTKADGSKATWIPIRLPKNGEVIDAWVREDVVIVQPTSEDDKPAAPVEPTPETFIPPVDVGITTPPAIVPAPTPEPPTLDLKSDMEALDVIIKQLEDELSEINHQLVKIDNRLRLLQNVRKDIAKLVTPEATKEIA